MLSTMQMLLEQVCHQAALMKPFWQLWNWASRIRSNTKMMWWITIHCFEWCKLCGSMEASIIPILCQRQPRRPLSKTSMNKATQVHVSRHWFTRSVCPLVYGWYAELMRSWVPECLNKACQRLLVNMRSRSEIINLGMPWSLHTLSMNVVATVRAVNGWIIGRKCAYRVSLSTTTRMKLKCLERAKPSIKIHGNDFPSILWNWQRLK